MLCSSLFLIISKAICFMKRFFFAGKEFEVFDSVYEPAEDSFLLVKNVIVQRNWNCLDLGCGSGIQSINLLMQHANVLAVDVNEIALENTLQNAKQIGLEKNLRIRKSNLFSAISNNELFDCIVFNPPYVPSNKREFVELDGGKNGREILDRFLQRFPVYLKKNGVCYFLQSSLNGKQKTKHILKKQGLNFEIIAQKKLFFEELMVFKVKIQ